MATKTQIREYSKYCIAAVESNFTWNSVYWVDAITLGMWQYWGPEAGDHLHRMKDETPVDYAKLAASLRANVEAHAASSSWWEGYHWTQAEGNSWKAVAKSSSANHALQEAQINEQQDKQIDYIIRQYGASLDNPKVLVYLLNIYHQTPAACGRVCRSMAAGTATLNTCHTTALNDRVLSKYRNRYNEVKRLLDRWDGTSAPPDYGQVGDVTTGGDSETISSEAANFRYIIQMGDTLVLYGADGSPYADGVLFYAAGAQRWIPARNPGRTTQVSDYTDSGSSTGTEAQNRIVELFKSWENKFKYSQSGDRLHPDKSGYGDCSSTVWRAYQLVTGKDIGTYTGAQRGKGKLIASGGPGTAFPVDKAQPADLLQVTHTNGVQHVEMYMGANKLMGHGSAPGPHWNKLSATEYCKTQREWQLRRYL